MEPLSPRSAIGTPESGKDRVNPPDPFPERRATRLPFSLQAEKRRFTHLDLGDGLLGHAPP
jgi:hypothetical protein